MATLYSNYGLVIGNVYYSLFWYGTTYHMQCFDASTSILSLLAQCNAGYEATSSKNQYSMAYDGIDLIYYVLKKTADGLNYLFQYSIAGNSHTLIREYNIALMLDRNCIGTANSPWEYEKAFHLTSPYIYQISRVYNHLWKLQDLKLTGGETIIAITDKYLITSNADFYEYQNCIDELPRARATYKAYSSPFGEFIYQTSLSTDTIIEIYELVGTTYTKCFSGKAGAPKYNNALAQYEFEIINFGNDDLDREISYTATAENISAVVINMINNNSKYLYADATSVPTIATAITYTWEGQRLRDCLYTLCILANGYWWHEPNGYFYFRTYANSPSADNYYYNMPDNLNKESVGTSGTNIKWVDTATLPNACTCTIIETLDSHGKVLKLTHDGGVGVSSITHTIDVAQTTGTHEWWWGSSDITRQQDFRFFSDTTVKIAIQIVASKYYYYDLSGTMIEIVGTTPTNNILAHFKCVFDCNTDRFNLYIDGVLRVNQGEFRGVATSINNIGVVNTHYNLYSQYIDAPGDVADPNYNEGDNLYHSLFTNLTNDLGPPTAAKLQNQFNTWSIKSGINPATGKPFFTKTLTDPAHILQYGECVWKGRDSFPEALTQATLDAIATGLSNWQGMQDNPDDAVSLITNKYYYPVGRDIHLRFPYLTEFATTKNMLIAGCRINFRNKGMIECHFTTNIMRLQ